MSILAFVERQVNCMLMSYPACQHNYSLIITHFSPMLNFI